MRLLGAKMQEAMDKFLSDPSQQNEINLITKIKPDVLVKGADYKGKEVVGSEIVKEVRLIDFVEGKSTTGIIKRIKDAKNDDKK